jgi:hypothetical protein
MKTFIEIARNVRMNKRELPKPFRILHVKMRLNQ